MAVSVVDIWNQALGALGAAGTVTSETEQSTEADAIRAVYETVRDELLATTDWPWAHRFSDRLSQLPDTEADPRPMQQYTYWYALPSDVLRVREGDVEFSPIRKTEPTPFTEFNDSAQGKVMAIDILNPMISYTYALVDPGLMSPGFIGSMKFRIASEIALKLTANPGLQQAMFTAYMRTLSMARSNITGIAPPSEESTFIAART